MPGARGVRRYPDVWASTTWWGYGALALALLGALVMLGDWRSGSYLTGLVRDDHWVTVTRSEVRLGPKSSKNPYLAVAAVRVMVPGSSAWLPLSELRDQPTLDPAKDWPTGWNAWIAPTAETGYVPPFRVLLDTSNGAARLGIAEVDVDAATSQPNSPGLPLLAGGLVVGILLLVKAPKSASSPPSELS